MSSNKDSKVLIIVGMHRSGTSLTTNWLNQCGLHIGQDLLGEGRSNQLGHFEDVDFLDFHQKVLIDNDLTWTLSQKNIEITSASIQKAKQLIAKKSEMEQWGWKDPRNCLFLDLWDGLIEQPFYLVIYRNYKEVIASLLRRRKNDLINENGKFLTRPFRYIQFYLSKKKLIKSYAETWIRYNEDILKFLKKNETKNVLMTNIDTLKAIDSSIIKQLNNFGFSLNHKSLSTVFKKQLMTGAVEIKLPIQLEKQCEELWLELLKQEKSNLLK